MIFKFINEKDNTEIAKTLMDGSNDFPTPPQKGDSVSLTKRDGTVKKYTVTSIEHALEERRESYRSDEYASLNIYVKHVEA